MFKNYSKLIEKIGEQKVFTNEPLSKYSSFHLGGPADLFIKVKTVTELIEAVTLARNFLIPYFIIGGGTNLLISDSGFKGLVIKNETSSIKLIGVYGGRKSGEADGLVRVRTVYVSADSGVGVNRLVRYALEQGLYGLEAFLGQPGSIGGSVWINSHNMKMGNFISDTLSSAEILKQNNEVAAVPKSYFKFGYDYSILQKTQDIVLSATFKFETGNKNLLWQKAKEALEHRRLTQPQGVFSAGCTFRNISKSEAIRIATPNYICSAGYLLEQTGLKGTKIGGASFSTDHSNFIVHSGTAKASEVFRLIQLAKQRVKQKFGVDLHEEVVLIGKF